MARESGVFTDASFRDGRAGLAMNGALGEKRKAISCRCSTEAELAAMVWAMSEAALAGLSLVAFHSDNAAVTDRAYGRPTRRISAMRFAVHAAVGSRLGWDLIRVPRRELGTAHALARLAYREAHGS